MSRLTARIKPANGFSQIAHWLLLCTLPLLVFVLTRLSFVQLAYAVVLLSKWRMFAVRPRHWPAHIRANAVDIMVGLSVVTFMAHNGPSQSFQLACAVGYGVWLLLVKPRSTAGWVSAQAMIGQLLALIAVFTVWEKQPLIVLVLSAWVICYFAARHFLTTFDEPLTSLLSHTWGYFAAALTWVLGHYLLFYDFMAQPALILTTLGYGVSILYYLEKKDRLSIFVRREIVLLMCAIVFVIILLSNWGDKAV
jgi:hypothetical protein